MMPPLPYNLAQSIRKYSGNIAFVIDEQKFTYQDFSEIIGGIQLLMTQLQVGNRIGIIANNDIETYSSILACIISGIAYVPIEPTHPAERNGHIISLAELNFILNSQPENEIPGLTDSTSCRFISTQKTAPAELTFAESLINETAYILFTSGTTGIPKGVPISYGNLEAFARNVAGMNLDITESSRFLQVFDLTFDLSVFSYLIPILNGASVYTLPKALLRYTLGVSLIEEQNITHVLTVPSFVSYLKPYFDEIKLTSVKIWLFCGEALKASITKEWQNCLPNAIIYNVYGPTEATIFCTSYLCDRINTLSRNDIVSIGQPFDGTMFKLVNDWINNKENAEKGELLIGGNQLTTGYIKNEERNKQAFESYENSNFYHSGDICSYKNGLYYYLGRNDTQVKVQGGYRVELSEVEHHARKCESVQDVVAIATKDNNDISVINLFIILSAQKEKIEEELQLHIPMYMFPKLITFVDEFPLNVNGKVDRSKLAQLNK